MPKLVTSTLLGRAIAVAMACAGAAAAVHAADATAPDHGAHGAGAHSKPSQPAHQAPGHVHGASPGHAHADSAIGQPGQRAKVTRTVTVRMDDRMRFTPSQLRVQRGETVRFVVRNAGAVPHELVLGTRADLQAHAEQMRATPDMKHEDANTVSLAPGARGELVWHFTRAGTVDFACTLPGHMEAGMVGQIAVTR